jgi:Arc/MetJ family transcription regulator
MGGSTFSALEPVKARQYVIHMKRTNLVLDEEILEEAVRVAGVKTYSRAVDMALRDFVRRAKARRILKLAGSGIWDGDLGEMRRDSPRSRR